MFNLENYKKNTIHFYSPKSGALTVTKNGEYLTLNFPADVIEKITVSDEITNCFDLKPESVYKGKSDYLFVFEKEEDIINIRPAYDEIVKLDSRGVIITAKGKNADFVSRFFAPQSGVNEDPVTGSAHTTLTPYWSKQLGRSDLTAIQLSQRKGYLKCRFLNDRVEITGQGKLYLTGEIYLE